MRRSIGRLAIAIAIFIFAATGAWALDGVEKRQVRASFEDAFFDLESAIIEQGFVIDSVLYVSEMLKRTGQDVGSTKPIYRNGRTVGFCSAKLSRAAMEAELDNLAFCPYTIFIYEAADDPGVINVGYRILAGASGENSLNALKEINSVLNKIVSSIAGN